MVSSTPCEADSTQFRPRTEDTRASVEDCPLLVDREVSNNAASVAAVMARFNSRLRP